MFSRYVVGWMVARRESAALAERLITTSCERQKIRPEQLTVHADRGAVMTSKTVALLLADLGVTKTHSRPHTSNDNPYSEAQSKTLKYRVHHGFAETKRAERAQVLRAAFAATPECFVRQLPVPPALPTAAWINPPKLLAVPAERPAPEDVRQ